MRSAPKAFLWYQLVDNKAGTCQLPWSGVHVGVARLQHNICPLKLGLQSDMLTVIDFYLPITRIVVEYTYRSPRGRICARGRITNIKVRSRRLFGMSWSIGCCFVCLFFDYFFSVGGCVFLCRIFFMSRYADALCIGPWRMICVVMHRMWVTMAKSMSMAGIVMGRCGIRMSTKR